MTRPARRASLLVVFCVLTSAATASAECAWVLWKQTVDMAVAMGPPAERDVSKLITWETRAAYEKKQACDDALATEERRLREAGASNPKLVCLPDTVDPRGSKVNTR